MHSAPTPTTTPARRATRPTPRLKHLVHHEEPNGTIHTLCGLKLHPRTGATTGPHKDKTQCAACDAARFLYEVGL